MTEPIPRTRSAGLVLAGAVLWGTTGTAQALGPAAADPLTVGAARLVLGGALLAGWALARRGEADRRVPARRWPAAAVGAVAVAAYQVTFFAAVDVAGVALGTAVVIGSSPVFTGLLETSVRRVWPDRRWVIATALGATGVVVLAGPSGIDPVGVVLGLAAGLSYGTFAVASKRLLDAGLASHTAMGVVFGGGAVLLMPVLVAGWEPWLTTMEGLAMVGWLGVVATLVAYLLFGAGLAGVTAATAATLSLAEPLTAAVLAVVLLAERPDLVAVIGGLLVLAGLAVLTVRPATGASSR